MSKAGNLWAVGFDEAERAAQFRDEITKLAPGRALPHPQGCGSGCTLSGRTFRY